MTAPRDLRMALSRLEYVLDHPLRALHGGDRETLCAVREALVSLIARCDSPDSDRAAIESLRSADAAE